MALMYDTYALVLESAELQANGKTYAGKLPEGEARWRTVEPSSKGYFNVYWQFNAPAPDAIGSEPVLLMTFRVNGDTKSMRIECTRE